MQIIKGLRLETLIVISEVYYPAASFVHLWPHSKGKILSSKPLPAQRLGKWMKLALFRSRKPSATMLSLQGPSEAPKKSGAMLLASSLWAPVTCNDLRMLPSRPSLLNLSMQTTGTHKEVNKYWEHVYNFYRDKLFAYYILYMNIYIHDICIAQPQISAIFASAAPAFVLLLAPTVPASELQWVAAPEVVPSFLWAGHGWSSSARHLGYFLFQV